MSQDGKVQHDIDIARIKQRNIGDSSISTKFRRLTRFFKDGMSRQVSEPIQQQPRSTPAPIKHDSYPESAVSIRKIIEHGNRRVRLELTRKGVTAVNEQTDGREDVPDDSSIPSCSQTRNSHVPALRAGPPVSCSYCWNTVDETGRILRRKTQYHCPECSTNLCIVPCFQEYHFSGDKRSGLLPAAPPPMGLK